MAKLLLGRDVTDAMNRRLAGRAAALRERGVEPTLAILRCGANPGDLSYERGAVKRAELVGVKVESWVFPEDVTEQALLDAIDRLNADEKVHGVLLLRPLPAHLRARSREICGRLAPRKDVDGMTDTSIAGVFGGRRAGGFPPCTPAACMEILDHYGISCRGKSAVVIGRSLVVGRPAAIMLMNRDATVTVCHTKTPNIPEICRRADIVISAAGALGSLTGEFVRPGQVVLDVSVNFDPLRPNARGGLGAIAGDAVFEQVEPVVAAITPVPGGVGGVTASVLMKHVLEAAEDCVRED